MSCIYCLCTAGGSSSSGSRSCRSGSNSNSSNQAVELTPEVESSFGDIVFAKQRDSSSTAWPAIVWDVRFCSGDIQQQAYAQLSSKTLVRFYGPDNRAGLALVSY
eukprot:8604-Heterococcus_DN1.PRE.4